MFCTNNENQNDIEERLDGHGEGDFKEDEIIDNARENPKEEGFFAISQNPL